MKTVLLSLLQVLLIIQSLSLYQPLQITQPVVMYLYTNGSSSEAYIQYQVSRQTTFDILFCFVRSKIQYSNPQNINGSLISNCSLKDESSNYFCARLYNQDKANIKNQVFYRDMNENLKTSDSYNNRYVGSQSKAQNLGTKNAQTIFNHRNLEAQQHSASTKIKRTLISYKQNQIIIIKDFFKQNEIYHMYTCPIYINQSKSCIQFWKQNYVQTRKSKNSNTKKINMIVQRKHYCGCFSRGSQNITTHVFYGGTLRQGNFVMFMAALTYLNDASQSLSMWGGISYSYDHANRDMFCYSTDGTAFDAVSLLVGPVYKDTASNILGTDDVKIVDTSYVQQGLSDMYFIQYHRIYDTGDRLGDERLFRKIYDQFAFAAYFQQVPAGSQILISPTCLSKDYRHNFLMSMTADLSVHLINLAFQVFLMIFLFFVCY